MIRLSGVSVRVPTLTPPGAKLLLDEVQLDLAEHRIALIGANGSGKSTLLRLLNGLLLPTQGRVVVDGLDTRTDAAQVRRRVGFTFTDPLSQLVLPTPLDDVELSLRARLRNRAERQAAARAWLDRYGLTEVAEHSIYDLSGGERQLAALVSVLAVEPSVLVCDEPTTLLDLRNRNLVAGVLDALPHQVILATHDLDLAARAERVVLIAEGRVAADGSPSEVIGTYRRSMA
ncbi:MAG: ABC transporter ATP-binding protein [Micropruina sp.]|nr:ABC transporter ATP-binding protein [Micropruina sp.]